MATGIYKRPGLEQRFWAKVQKTDSCWLWMAAATALGYGVIGDGKRLIYAHRVSWGIANGDPGSNCVLHRCDVPRCVNPDHLFLGTKADNSRDMAVKKRGTAKFSAEQIQQIRAQSKQGDSQRTIAKRWHVSQPAIGYILTGKTYKHTEATDAEVRASQ